VKIININEIVSNSIISDWEYDSDTGLLMHKTIENLLIEKVVQPPTARMNCFWYEQCEVVATKKIEYIIQYDRMYIARYSFIEIDNDGINLPLPRLGTNEITMEQFNLARIVNLGSKIDTYVKQANVTINEVPII
jgi:hypothetical protein